MDERLRFVARLLDGEKMAALCREFDVSRTDTGGRYKPLPMCPEWTLIELAPQPGLEPGSCGLTVREEHP